MRSHWPLLAIALHVFPASVWGWGEEGHETVCEIAYLELTAEARDGLHTILSEAADGEGETFREGCTWPDRPGAIQTSRRPDHYINVPRNWEFIWYEKCVMGADDCLFTAIRSDLNRVASDGDHPAERARALKFLGHWMGDLHQPLHVSFRDDKGGNELPLESEIGCKKRLHDVWDNCIPEDLMGERGTTSTEEFANALHSEISEADRSMWLSDGLSLVAWANESYAIAREAFLHRVYAHAVLAQAEFVGEVQRSSDSVARNIERFNAR